MTVNVYPEAKLLDVVDDLHGELVPDPYRWLEDTAATDSKAWIEAENFITDEWLARIPGRQSIGQRLTELLDYSRFGVPFERGARWFQWRQEGLANQRVLYTMGAPDDVGRVLLDPNVLSADGTVAINEIAVSDDGAMVAYTSSNAGSDWRTWRVRDVGTGVDLPDVVEWSKFTTAAWRRDLSGFYYGLLDRPSEGHEHLDANRTIRIAFHRLGSPQDVDEVVWHSAGEPEWLPELQGTEDGRYLVVTVTRGTVRGNQVHIADLTEPVVAFRPLVDDFDHVATVVGNDGPTFYLVTDYRAERLRLVAASLHAPNRSQWREVVPEQVHTLVMASNYGGRLVCHHSHDAQSRLSVYTVTGVKVHDVDLPSCSLLKETSGTKQSSLFFYSTMGFTDPGTIWSHDLGRGTTTQVRAPGAPFDGDAYVAEQVFVASDDGTRVPMFLVHHRDVEPTGDVPTLLNGYGGFNRSYTPRFRVEEAVWLERGGLLAVACLRGGGEYGRAWYDAGRLAGKQNVFDDFCACARWLFASGWTSNERLAISGASNGGLLVAACLNQHPELFGAAVIQSGLLDMLRYHRFTIGWAWIGDYGDPDDPDEYRWIRAYSPLHNIRLGAAYPATLITTGDHDDRVVPGHSFKFAAALQAAQGGAAPILIRVETSSGHGHGEPTDKAIAERCDVLAFLEQSLGVGARGSEVAYASAGHGDGDVGR